MKKEEYEVYYGEASRDVDDDMECLQEKCRRKKAHRIVLDAGREAFYQADELREQVERQQQEIDDLNEQLEQKDAEMANMRLQHQAEIDALQKQLLEAQNNHLESEKQHLESEKQQLVAEVKAKPMEIHNHFEPGSNSQVFNDRVNGHFEKKKKDKKDKKDKKNKRWKKIVRKML